MQKKLLAFILKRINWGKLLPSLFRAIAEGEMDARLGLTAPSGIRAYPLKRLYWVMAGIKTFTGMALLGVGAGLDMIAASYPDATWAAPAARACYLVGGFLMSIGLVDGGTRAPWPTGTPAK